MAQPSEIYHGRPILYSLGNCLFAHLEGRKQENGKLALVRLARGKVTVEKEVPLQIVEARPVPVK